MSERSAARLRSPREMAADEFYGEYIVIPKTDDPDGDELVIFGATIEEAHEIVAAVNRLRQAESNV